MLKPNSGANLLKAFWIIVASIVMPSKAGVYFETSWNTATGNSQFALTDGYRFNGGCYGNELLKVETGGIAGNNLYGIWLNGEQYAHTWAKQLPIMEYPDLYYRFYVRVYPKTGIRYPNFHGIQNYEKSYPDNFYFSVRDEGDPNSWTCGIGSYAAQPEGMDKGYLYNGGLDFNRWYRVEGRIHWYNHADWAAPTTWNLQVYDDNNNMVFDETNLIGMATRTSMQNDYNQGKRIYLNGNTTTWSMGTNGPYQGTGQGRVHDVSCVALGNDASVWGPVTTKLPADNLAPKASSFYPAWNATGVAAATPITLTLTEQGFGLDTGSIVMKVNGVVVKPTCPNSLWLAPLFYKPPQSFPPGEKVNVEISAKDLATPPNAMAPLAYSFTIAGVSSIGPTGYADQKIFTAGHQQAIYNLLGQKQPTAPGGTAMNASTRMLIFSNERGNRVRRVIADAE